MLTIYFEDDSLKRDDPSIPKNKICVDAVFGLSNNLRSINMLMRRDGYATVYTNQIALLESSYCWNFSANRPEVFLRSDDNQWANITSFTEKEIRFAHNLGKMYISGTFNNK